MSSLMMNSELGVFCAPYGSHLDTATYGPGRALVKCGAGWRSQPFPRPVLGNGGPIGAVSIKSPPGDMRPRRRRRRRPAALCGETFFRSDYERPRPRRPQPVMQLASLEDRTPRARRAWRVDADPAGPTTRAPHYVAARAARGDSPSNRSKYRRYVRSPAAQRSPS